MLGEAAEALKQFPEVRVEVRVTAGNEPLSQARADAVVGWLVAHGVDPRRMIARTSVDAAWLSFPTERPSTAVIAAL